jgi:hypothetical protein
MFSKAKILLNVVPVTYILLSSFIIKDRPFYYDLQNEIKTELKIP